MKKQIGYELNATRQDYGLNIIDFDSFNAVTFDDNQIQIDKEYWHKVELNKRIKKEKVIIDEGNWICKILGKNCDNIILSQFNAILNYSGESLEELEDKIPNFFDSEEDREEYIKEIFIYFEQKSQFGLDSRKNKILELFYAYKK